MNIIQDIKTAVKLTREVRRARERGATSIQIKAMKTMPVFTTDGWGWTPESCLFFGKQWQAVRDTFDTFDDAVKHDLAYTPGDGWDGSWPDRVRFWQQHLKPVLPPKMYHTAMLKIIDWCTRCVKRRLGVAV